MHFACFRTAKVFHIANLIFLMIRFMLEQNILELYTESYEYLSKLQLKLLYFHSFFLQPFSYSDSYPCQGKFCAFDSLSFVIYPSRDSVTRFLTSGFFYESSSSEASEYSISTTLNRPVVSLLLACTTPAVHLELQMLS